MKKILLYCCLICVFLIGILARVYRISEFTLFRGDQGSDLLIAHTIIFERNRPLIGPLLSVLDYVTPPTYYVILSIFYAIFRSPEGVAICFLLMNLLCMGILYILASLIVDKKTGVIASVLFALSSEMVEQSRNMWQPQPIQFFILCYLLFFEIGYCKKQTLLVQISIWFYVISTSIYPSPLLLLPYVCYRLYEYCKTIKMMNQIQAFMKSILMLIIPAIFIYSPLLIYEFNQNQLLLKALRYRLFVFPNSLSDILIRFLANLVSIHNTFIPVKLLSEINYPLILLIIIVILYAIILLGVRRKFEGFNRFLRLEWLLMGFVSVIFFTLDVESHRLWTFLPFLFIALAATIRFSFQKKSIIFSGFAIMILSIYFGSNARGIYNQIPKNGWTADLQTVRMMSAFIFEDSAMKHKKIHDVTVLFYTDLDTDNYNVDPYLFVLHTNYGYPIKLMSDGNFIDKTSFNTTMKPLVYLFCSRYYSYDDTSKRCIQSFLKNNQGYILDGRREITYETEIVMFHRDVRE